MANGRTIQEFIDSGDRYEARCQNPRCNHHAALDMIKLGDRLGPDHGALHDDLAPKLRCSKCGSKKIGLLRSPRGNDQRGQGGAHGMSNNYAKAKGG